jgi:tRNA G18 (ribose-2'-O)-methylase SpoU
MNDPTPLDSDRHLDAGDVRTLPRAPIHVILDNLRSAFNVGSIIRTSEAGRIAHLHLCGFTARPPHRQIARTALGATRHVPWTHHPDAATAILHARRERCAIWGIEITPDAESYLDAPATFPLALVFGHEVRGLAPDTLAAVDRVVQIPMYGIKNSLNVATSYGIVLFELRRRLHLASAAGEENCT